MEELFVGHSELQFDLEVRDDLLLDNCWYFSARGGNEHLHQHWVSKLIRILDQWNQDLVCQDVKKLWIRIFFGESILLEKVLRCDDFLVLRQ